MLTITKALDNLKDKDEDLKKTNVIWQLESAFIAALHQLHLEGKQEEKGELCENYLLCLKEVKYFGFFALSCALFEQKV